MNDPRLQTGFSGSSPVPFHAMDAVAHVTQENGRWVVLLNVLSWEPGSGDHPVVNHWKRICDCSTEQEAVTKASWIERAAGRTIRPLSDFQTRMGASE